ncbi:MAG: biotin--[acetyl-CoA-carboxylase] ligase [Candidatus Rokuibacteriota bacterium]|nr:MAG: biotin--[acetyl-CoA-carboxylase] ligase [Candidatus Rokubacteria bacterium]
MTVGGSTPGVVVRLDTVDSTQSVAFALAERGAADRTVVVADQQLEGRGRRGRTWRAPAGTSLLASIIVRPRLPQALLATLSLATAVATAEALRRVARVETKLKWPNDVLVGGRKIAGILLESRTAARAETGSSVTAGIPPLVTIIGIGINLGQREFSPDLADSATSVALETGHAPSRESLLTALLEEREGWRRLSDTLGRRVTVDAVTGVAADLDTDGALLIDVGGSLTRVLAGAVSSGDTAVGSPVPP